MTENDRLEAVAMTENDSFTYTSYVGRETEAFIRGIRDLPLDMQIREFASLSPHVKLDVVFAQNELLTAKLDALINRINEMEEQAKAIASPDKLLEIAEQFMGGGGFLGGKF